MEPKSPSNIQESILVFEESNKISHEHILKDQPGGVKHYNLQFLFPWTFELYWKYFKLLSCYMLFFC